MLPTLLLPLHPVPQKQGHLEFEVIALYDYPGAEREGKLPLSKGQHYTVLECSSDWWKARNSDGWEKNKIYPISYGLHSFHACMYQDNQHRCLYYWKEQHQWGLIPLPHISIREQLLWNCLHFEWLHRILKHHMAMSAPLDHAVTCTSQTSVYGKSAYEWYFYFAPWTNDGLDTNTDWV